MAYATEEQLSLNDILDDLKRVVSTAISTGEANDASYETVQTALPDLALHVLTYIRFLENHGYIQYDRVADEIRVEESGKIAVNDPHSWSDEVRRAFADHLGEEHGGFDPLDDEVNELLDSVIEIDESDDNIIRVDDGLELANDPSFSESFEEQSVEPIETPEPVDSGPAMSNQDSFASRRLASSSQPAAQRSTNTANLYERHDVVGSGGYGTVYRSSQLKLNREVAIKEVKEIFDVFAGVQRADIIERFTRIVQTQSKLLHPNIIQVMDIDTEAQFPFVVMQYAPNGNLRRLIDADERPNLQISIKYFFQILHALNTAHDNAVTHGGIKPENVVLDHAGNALVTDFGISSIADLDANKGASQVYVGVGTVAYMSPEQFRNPNSSSVKSDIYSLGIMFYEMLTGKVPGRRSPMPSSFYPDIPRKLDDVFDRMSMDDPKERYDTIDEVLRDLYESDDVMSIIDKRGGFVFLRDPIVHGVTGIDGLKEEDIKLPETDGNLSDKLDKYGALFDGDE